MGELLGFLRREIDNEQIHAVVAVGDKIDLVVRSPHRADVLGGVVRQIFGSAGFEIVDPNVVRHAATIMFPCAELPEHLVISHLGVIRRKRNETAARHRQLLGQFCVQPDRKQCTDEIVERLHARTKDDQRLRILPCHH